MSIRIKCLQVAAWLLASGLAPSALAETVTLDFDGPDYFPGQSINRVDDINFVPAAVVFAPTGVATFTGTQALRTGGSCTTADCPSGAHRMQIRFGTLLPLTNNQWIARPASRVSFRIGADNPPPLCFPEGTTCPMYASITAFDNAGNPVVTPQEVFLFDASTFSAPITREITLVDPQARIARVAITYGKGTLSHDIGYPGEPQIDHLVVEFPDAPPPGGSTPPPPTIQITEPTGSRAAPFNVRLRGAVQAPGSIAAFCYTLNQSPPPTGAACTQLGQLAANNTFDIAIPDEQLAAGANTLTVRVYDLHGQSATQSTTVTTLAPAAPVVTVTTPGGGQWLNPSANTSLAGSVRTVGKLKGFCVQVNAPAAPNPLHCTQELGAVNHSNPSWQPLLYSTLLSPQRFSAGQNTISVFAVDRWNQMGRADVMVNAPTDLRVVAMEINQGIQTFELPLNTSGSAPYRGVNLRQGVPTVVRVFTNTPFAGSYAGARMLLSGFRPDPNFGESPLGAVLPDSSPSAITTGGMSVTTAERFFGTGGFTFTLPTSWTLINGLRLEAKLTPPFGLQECPGCAANNSFSVTGINFGPAIGVTISPVALTFTDPVTGAFTAPPPSATAFTMAATISPVPPASFVVRPYVGTIDVSDLVGPGGSCRGMANSSCEDAVHTRMVSFNRMSPQPGHNIAVGPVDVGLDIPGFVARPPFGQFEFGHIAIADTRGPMIAVAHEFYHMLNYFHASPCGVGANLFNMWPPDEKGYIHGVGIDRRRLPDSTGTWNGRYTPKVPGSGSLIGGREEWFDLMSYCASDFSAWISVENWNAFGGPLPNGLIPDSLILGQSTATINTDGAASSQQPLEVEGGVLYASVVLDAKGRPQFVRVAPGGRHLYEDPAKGEYEFVARDAKGREIARLTATVTLRMQGEGEDPGVHAAAYLPAARTASIELQHHGEVIVRRERSRSIPWLDVERPEVESVSREGSIELRWKADDEDRDTLDIMIEFSAGPEQPFRAIHIGPNSGRWRVEGALLDATRDGRLRVSATDGFNRAEYELPIVVQASPPQVEIHDLVDGMSLPQSTPIRLRATAFGNGQMPLRDEDIVWTLDGVAVGTGAAVEVLNVAPGKHVAQVVAREGRLATLREVTFVVRPVSQDLSEDAR